jgi:hypothetical protein
MSGRSCRVVDLCTLILLLLLRSCCRELELDAQLRALQTNELPIKLTAHQLQMLLQSAY